jgi:uncharacterized Ntn-hydrolase superfamily protein
MTYSIVARDPATGQLGVAVQSYAFSVGSIVTWARAGVGAVATQAGARLDYGPRGLDLMADGKSAPAALAALHAADPGAASRQVAMVDASGGVVGYTGPSCISYASDIQADAVSCQANIMTNEGVPEAMLDAYLRHSGSLTDRLFAALLAAEKAGGDLRGRQSAALLVVPAEGEAWDRFELRVEDHAEPLEELRRLVGVREAYDLAEQADEAMGEGRHDDAARLGREALALTPDNHELLFWAGLGLAQSGDIDQGVAMVRRAIDLQPGWGELIGRLSPELAPSAADVAARL